MTTTDTSLVGPGSAGLLATGTVSTATTGVHIDNLIVGDPV